jgi:hypothetical protein
MEGRRLRDVSCRNRKVAESRAPEPARMQRCVSDATPRPIVTRSRCTDQEQKCLEMVF